MSLPIGVLISGRGSNLQKLIQTCVPADFPAHIKLVIANRPDAAGLQMAAKAGIATAIIDHRKYGSRTEFEDAMSATLRNAGVEFICLAGFMRLLSAGFVEEWQGKLINIHPSLLPAFKGLATHDQALMAGVKLHGCTVHYVSAKMDAGAIIGQAAVPVLHDDTPQSLATRVLEAEHRLYPACLEAIIRGEIRFEHGKVVSPASLRRENEKLLNF